MNELSLTGVQLLQHERAVAAIKAAAPAPTPAPAPTLGEVEKDTKPLA